jgi:uncharacterized cofD-like protein
VSARPIRVVAFGGGKGLSASLSALRRIPEVDVTAVVTVADNGGSSGRLRGELGALPPGDLRKALGALAGPDQPDQVFARLFEHRFGGHGPLSGHAVGNLVLAGLLDLEGEPVAALERARQMLSAVGRVLPMSVQPLDIEAEVTGLDPGNPTAVRVVRGQVEVATTSGRVGRVRLLPDRPETCPEAAAAAREADWVLLGPGSWYTSVLPHLLVPGLAEAIVRSDARRVVALNLSASDAEVRGMSPADHLHALSRHAPGLRVDHVLADPSICEHDTAHRGGVRFSGTDGLRRAAESLGGALVVAPVAEQGGAPRHDPAALARALRTIMGVDAAEPWDDGSTAGPGTAGQDGVAR